MGPSELTAWKILTGHCALWKLRLASVLIRISEPLFCGMRNVLDSTNHRIVREFSWEYAEAGHLMIRWQLVTPYRSILVLNLLSPLVENSSCPVICGSGAD